VHEFVRKLEKIEPPNQLVAAINDTLLQKYLLLRSSDTNSQRIDSWLFALFEDQLEDSTSSEGKIFEMLEAVLGYTEYTRYEFLALKEILLKEPRNYHLRVWRISNHD
jgi:centromere protein I